MPTPAKYASAIDECALMAEACVDQSAMRLALRCLRVVAAMEAGTVVCIKPWRTGRPDEQWSATNANDETFYEADPLTAAERAMGVGT